MSARWQGRRLPNCDGGVRGRCELVRCFRDLSCLAGHPTNSHGELISFGYGAGDALDVRPSTIPRAGKGLFAKKLFEQNEVITTYDGHVSHNIFAPPAHTRGSQIDFFSHLHSIRGTEFVVWGFVFPTQGRGLGSFVNHSVVSNAVIITRSQQFPYINIQNCPDLTRHLVVVAKRNIYIDEEIFVTYPPHTCARLHIDWQQ